MDPAPRSSPRAWLLGLLIAAALIAIILNFGELRRFGELAVTAKPQWLLVGVALQLSTYLFVAAGWAVVLKAGGAPRSLRMLAPVAVAKLFTDQVVPSAGVSGNALLVDRLIASGVPRGQAASALLISIIGYYFGFAAIALLVLGLLWVEGHATLMLAATFSLFMLVALAIPALAMGLTRMSSSRIPALLLRLPIMRSLLDAVAEAPRDLFRDRSLMAQVAVFNALVILADSATLLAMLVAVGQPGDFGPALTALVVASIVITLGPIPLGLGSFEASCIGMLRLSGIPLEAAVAATLLLRGLTLWLPLIPGLMLARRYAGLRKRKPARADRANLASVPPSPASSRPAKGAEAE